MLRSLSFVFCTVFFLSSLDLSSLAPQATVEPHGPITHVLSNTVLQKEMNLAQEDDRDPSSDQTVSSFQLINYETEPYQIHPQPQTGSTNKNNDENESSVSSASQTHLQKKDFMKTVNNLSITSPKKNKFHLAPYYILIFLLILPLVLNIAGLIETHLFLYLSVSTVVFYFTFGSITLGVSIYYYARHKNSKIKMAGIFSLLVLIFFIASAVCHLSCLLIAQYRLGLNLLSNSLNLILLIPFIPIIVGPALWFSFLIIHTLYKKIKSKKQKVQPKLNSYSESSSTSAIQTTPLTLKERILDKLIPSFWNRGSTEKQTAPLESSSLFVRPRRPLDYSPSLDTIAEEEEEDFQEEDDNEVSSQPFNSLTQYIVVQAEVYSNDTIDSLQEPSSSIPLAPSLDEQINTIHPDDSSDSEIHTLTPSSSSEKVTEEENTPSNRNFKQLAWKYFDRYVGGCIRSVTDTLLSGEDNLEETAIKNTQSRHHAHYGVLGMRYPQMRSTLRYVKEERNKQGASLFNTLTPITTTKTQDILTNIPARQNIATFLDQHHIELQVNLADSIYIPGKNASLDNEVLAQNDYKKEGNFFTVQVDLNRSLEDIVLLAQVGDKQYEDLLEFIILNEVIQALHRIEKQRSSASSEKTVLSEKDTKELEAGSQVTALLALASLKGLSKKEEIQSFVENTCAIIEKVIRSGWEYLYSEMTYLEDDPESIELKAEEEKLRQQLSIKQELNALEKIKDLALKIPNQTPATWTNVLDAIHEEHLETKLTEATRTTDSILSAS